MPQGRARVLRQDGNLPHCTLPIGGNGERFSLVYFSAAGCLSDKFADNDREELVRFGFVMPRVGHHPTGPLVYRPADKGERLSKGREQYGKYLSRMTAATDETGASQRCQ